MGAELLRERHKDPQSLSTLALLELCAKRGANLVKQILAFARGVEGRRITVYVGRLIIDLGKILERTFPKSIRIVTDVVPDLWTVSGDRTQLEQVLMNLCVNARDAMPTGGTLTVTARNQIQDSDGPIPKKGRNVVIEVGDTGEGIPSENLGKIFDPFFTTKQIGTGTGLGLSTVNAIVKSHGGFVTVESSVKRGTAFRVYLPALAHDVPQEEDVTAMTFPAGDGELILVVDDEAAVRDLARTILENYGYRVLVASDGAEGVTLYSQNKDQIDLVLTDLDMPRMNGAEMIQVLERIDPEIRVITVSGLVDGDASEQQVTGHGSSRRAGREGWTVLQKPFSPAQLLQTLRNVLHGS